MNEEYVLASKVLEELHVLLAVGKGLALHLPKRRAKSLGDLFREAVVGTEAKYAKVHEWKVYQRYST